MADTRQGEGEGVDDGANARPLNDTVAQTGPGIPDDAASPDYDPVADADEERRAESAPEPPDADTLFNGP